MFDSPVPAEATFVSFEKIHFSRGRRISVGDRGRVRLSSKAGGGKGTYWVTLADVCESRHVSARRWGVNGGGSV